MPAIFTSPIGQRNYELIRSKICSCLLVELANQSVGVSKVWEQRFIPLNEETETPTVNVSIEMGNNDNRNVVKWDGSYLFNIDVYTTSNTTDANGPGDQYAMWLMMKIVGMIEVILMSDAYKTLLLSKGIIIGLPMVERFFVADKGTVSDALSGVVGRIQYRVNAIETVEAQLVPGVELQEATLTAFLNGSTYGYYYSLNTAVPPPVNTNTIPRSILLRIVTSPDLSLQIPVGNGHFIQAEYAPCDILIPKLSTDAGGYLANRPYTLPFYYNSGVVTKPLYTFETGEWDRTGFGEGLTGFVNNDEILITFEDFIH